MKIIEGIKNLWKWKSIIWNDRWWDSYFLFKILKFKLEQMEENFRERGIHVSAEKEADKMKICVLLLDRLIKDEYDENVFKHHYEKWGEPEFSSSEINDELSQLHITHKNVITEEDEKQERKEFRILCKKPYKMEKQDVEYLFKLLSKNILTWWD